MVPNAPPQHPRPEEDWAQSYYDALEFFYWEPQRIGRKKPENPQVKSIDDLRRKLRRMEVTLNHNLQQFFLLAPHDFRARVFHKMFGTKLTAQFSMYGRDVDNEFQLKNKVQPDLLFVAEKYVLSIEMKVGAKNKLEQVRKYALLGLAVELATGHTLEHRLGFLGKGDFASQWKEPIGSRRALRRALEEDPLGGFDKKLRKHFRDHTERLREIVLEMRFGYLNYADLGGLVSDELSSVRGSSRGAEVYRNLLGGLLAELQRRKLCS